MSTGEENETVGPKVGIKLDKSQADLVIRRHFPQLTVKNLQHINAGYNNRVYIVTTSDNHEYILRLCGRFWTQYKTENEIATLLYFAKHCESLPVPRVFGYCTDKSKSGINAEYILMEKVDGEQLQSIWDDLDMEGKRQIGSQIATIFSKFQKITFPQIGSFEFNLESLKNPIEFDVSPEKLIGEDKKFIKVGKGVDCGCGPFDTFIEYFKSTCEVEMGLLRHCPFMRESEGYAVRLERIQKFVDAFEKLETLPAGISREVMENVPFVFTHGDLALQNLLVNKETRKITGVLDWEFAGSYPVDEEWFSSFAFADCDTSDRRVFNDEQPTSIDNDDADDPEMSNSLREYFFDQFRKNGVVVPDDISGHMIRAELFYFRGFICPWWLREKRDPIPESHYNDRKNACNKVDYILEKYGF